MSEYITTIELRPRHDGRKSFHGKAAIQLWDTGSGVQYVLKSYGSTVATVTPAGARGVVPETYEVKVAMGPLGATTLRHVKEFLAQTDDVFRGVTLPWLRRAVKDGRHVDGAVREPVCRKTFVMAEL